MGCFTSFLYIRRLGDDERFGRGNDWELDRIWGGGG